MQKRLIEIYMGLCLGIGTLVASLGWMIIYDVLINLGK